MAPISRDTLDIRRGSLPNDTWRELGRNANRNLRAGHQHFRSLDNGPELSTAPRSLTSDFLSGRTSRDAYYRAKPSNGNLLWVGGSQRGRRLVGGPREVQGSLSLSDQEQGTANAEQASARARRKINMVTNIAPAGRESPRMAAIAPFRFRWENRSTVQQAP